MRQDYTNENIDSMESALVLLVNTYCDDYDVYLEKGEYFRLNFSIWNKSNINTLIDIFKFKSIGNRHDYPEILPQQESFTNSDMYTKYEDSDKIAISEEYKAVIMYSIRKYDVTIMCIIDKNKFKKFSKKLNVLLTSQNNSGLFNNTDFKCKRKEYIEISDVINEEDNQISVQKKKIPKENLVFDTNSSIFNVMEDIKLFFKKDTKKLYSDMNILYKRGVIIYGNPGNGKTAMIRELIRQLVDITVIIINPNTQRVPFVLSELIDALKGKPAIIVIEDIDSVIVNSNRSEFLNILDGIKIISGVYFIGTTNYPDKIDPAFVNRPGRFDRMYKIDNPGQTIRQAFFRNCKLDQILSKYKIHKPDSENKELGIIDLYTKYSDGLSMANLKELLISTQYKLISDKSTSIEEALEITSKILLTPIETTDNEYPKRNYYNRGRRNYDYDKE